MTGSGRSCGPVLRSAIVRAVGEDAGQARVRPMDPGWEVPPSEVTVLRPKTSRHAVIVPVWNEGERFERQLRGMTAYTRICDIIVSDAPSTDGSTALPKLREADVHARISLTAPGGLSASLRAAMAYALTAGFEGIILIDGNGKDDPDGLVRFTQRLDAGADYAQGSRYLPGGRAINTPLYRTILIRLVHAPVFSLLCRRWFTDTTIGFRAFSSRFLLDRRVRPFRRMFEHYDLYFYLAWAACHYGFHVTDVPVTRSYPPTGPIPTKITLFRGNWRMLRPLLMILFRRY